MSKKILTKGWPGPKGKCDICKTKPAAYWFGDTSVALCGDSECSATNRRKWEMMIEEMEREERINEENDYNGW